MTSKLIIGLLTSISEIIIFLANKENKDTEAVTFLASNRAGGSALQVLIKV